MRRQCTLQGACGDGMISVGRSGNNSDKTPHVFERAGYAKVQAWDPGIHACDGMEADREGLLDCVSCPSPSNALSWLPSHVWLRASLPGQHLVCSFASRTDIKHVPPISDSSDGIIASPQ